MTAIRSAPVGFIGLGAMGEPMALNLLKAGTALLVWNRSPSKSAVLGKAGAAVAKYAAEVLARCEMVIPGRPPSTREARKHARSRRRRRARGVQDDCEKRVVAGDAEDIDDSGFAEGLHGPAPGRIADPLVVQNLQGELVRRVFLLVGPDGSAPGGDRLHGLAAQSGLHCQRIMDCPFVILTPDA